MDWLDPCVTCCRARKMAQPSGGWHEGQKREEIRGHPPSQLQAELENYFTSNNIILCLCNSFVFRVFNSLVDKSHSIKFTHLKLSVQWVHYTHISVYNYLRKKHCVLCYHFSVSFTHRPWETTCLPSLQTFLYWAFYVTVITEFTVLCDWLLSLSTVCSEFLPSCSHPFIPAEYCSTVRIHQVSFTHSQLLWITSTFCIFQIMLP